MAQYLQFQKPPAHDPNAESIITIYGRGLFKMDLDTDLPGAGKISCLRAWAEPEIDPLLGQVYPDVYGYGHYYDVASDRIFYCYQYYNKDFIDKTPRIARINPRTLVKEAEVEIALSVGFSAGLFGNVIASSSYLFALSATDLYVLDKVNLSTVAQIPWTYGQSRLFGAVDDSTIVVGPPLFTSDTIKTLQVNTVTPSISMVSETAALTYNAYCWLPDTKKLLMTPNTVGYAGNYLAFIIDPVGSTQTQVGQLPVGFSGYVGAYSQGEIDTRQGKVLITYSWNPDGGAPSSVGIIEIDTVSGAITRYIGFYKFTNGPNPSEINSPNYNSPGNFGSAMYGPGNTAINTVQSYATRQNEASFNQIWLWNIDTSPQFPPIVEERQGHFPDRCIEVDAWGTQYATTAYVLPRVFTNFFGFFRRLPAKVPADAPPIAWNTTPPPATPITRQGNHYLSPVFNIPQNTVKWVTVQHDGATDTRIIPALPEDLTSVSVDPEFFVSVSADYLVCLTAYDADGKVIGFNGTRRQQPYYLVYDTDYAPLTIPAAYPEGSYHVAIIPASIYYENGLYSDHEFYASAVGVQGDLNIRVRVEHLQPVFDEAIPSLLPSQPDYLSFEPFLDTFDGTGTFIGRLSNSNHTYRIGTPFVPSYLTTLYANELQYYVVNGSGAATSSKTGSGASPVPTFISDYYLFDTTKQYWLEYDVFLPEPAIVGKRRTIFVGLASLSDDTGIDVTIAPNNFQTNYTFAVDPDYGNLSSDFQFVNRPADVMNVQRTLRLELRAGLSELRVYVDGDLVVTTTGLPHGGSFLMPYIRFNTDAALGTHAELRRMEIGEISEA